MHTVIVKDNNDVLVFGANDYGQLGLGHNDDQNKPITLMQEYRYAKSHVVIIILLFYRTTMMSRFWT